ncbi:hypothetical protein P43SY_011449 [Pythium insidiosum]|uniref:Uncharacterized protein n=1 Tax=Pythium insidiosum TaxID=114742 RepID=A0AAD5LX93_PYTIN|nr:hypothetical protein P43SY_011449 [Pythium insidiosum]
MDALFRGLVKNMPFAGKDPSGQHSVAGDSPVIVHSPRSYHMPAYPMASEWEERQRRSLTGTSGETRIAHWDKKREKCLNCKHIYLKTLSRHPGFCSVDCKSNAAYLDKVNRTIKAVRNAVEQLKEKESAPEPQPEPAQCEQQPEPQPEPEREQTQVHVHQKQPVQTPVELEREGMDIVPGLARSFAEFGLEERLQHDHQVEWAFSAIY